MWTVECVNKHSGQIWENSSKATGGREYVTLKA